MGCMGRFGRAGGGLFYGWLGCKGVGVMGESINIAFGQRMRTAMAVARVSRHQLARACAVSPQAVQKWCDGAAYPSPGKLMTIVELTGCSAEWLMWPYPVDILTTDWAINGRHIKNIVQSVLDEIGAKGGAA